ncbi:MAG: ribosome small subunit-dependent GTPase A [Faecousia sp.]
MEEVRARVVSQEKGLYRLKCEYGEKLGEVSGKYMYRVSTVSEYPAVGDYVIAGWPGDDSHAIIQALFPRKSCFIRKAAGKDRQEQVVAANVDNVFLCMSLNSDFNLRRLERYLAIAWDSGATPVVVLTKADLCHRVEEIKREVESVAVGVDLIVTSSLSGDIRQVSDYIRPGKTVAFLGSSGVGKSTLINRLLGAELLQTNGLRDDDKGRHTTTHRELIELENGAFVIDTPGMRELGMWDSESGIDTVFRDIQALERSCRFSDCSHSSEPGCAVLAALAEGTLTEDRWRSYQKLKAENGYSSGSGDYLAAKKEKFKNIAKINKANRKR